MQSNVFKIVPVEERDPKKIYVDEETAKSFRSLGQILLWAKQEKERREKEEMFKEAGIDPSKINQQEEIIPEIDLETKLASR